MSLYPLVGILARSLPYQLKFQQITELKKMWVEELAPGELDFQINFQEIEEMKYGFSSVKTLMANLAVVGLGVYGIAIIYAIWTDTFNFM